MSTIDALTRGSRDPRTDLGQVHRHLVDGTSPHG